MSNLSSSPDDAHSERVDGIPVILSLPAMPPAAYVRRSSDDALPSAQSQVSSALAFRADASLVAAAISERDVQLPGSVAPATKLAYLDSMRGLASIIVVLAHSAGVFYPHAIFGAKYQISDHWEQWLTVPPFSLLISGHFAVCLFFVLSGYVLSVRFITGAARAGDLSQAALKRPVRLGGMVLFTAALGFVLMSANVLHPNVLGDVRLPWLETFWQHRPTQLEFWRNILSGPFKNSQIYNPPLWTIHKELVGSYLVFAYIALAGRISPRARWCVLGVLSCLTFRSLYVGFVIGLAFAEAQHRPQTMTRSCSSRSWWRHVWQRCQPMKPFTSAVLLLMGLWLASQMHYQRHDVNTTGSVVSRLTKLANDFGTGGAGMLAAALVFAAVSNTPRYQRLLDRPLLRFFGNISFAVYALHFLLLGSAAAAVHRGLVAHIGWHASASISTILTFACLIPLSVLATRWIDRPSIAMSVRVANSVRKIGRVAATYRSA